jgi:hypothetical protein
MFQDGPQHLVGSYVWHLMGREERVAYSLNRWVEYGKDVTYVVFEQKLKDVRIREEHM